MKHTLRCTHGNTENLISSLRWEIFPTTKNKGSPHFTSGPKDEQGSLATVDDYVLRHDPSLQHAHLGVVATATEKPRRFYLEVGNSLSVVIHNTETIFF